MNRKASQKIQKIQSEDAIIDDVVKNIDKSIVDRLKAVAEKKRLSILIVGRTGVGKSSTINSMMGENVAEVGEFEPVTTKVKPYHSKLNGVPYSVYDTPGLCDNLPEKGLDNVYLERIIKGVPYVDTMMYVSRLDDNRATADEIRGIKLVTQAFGPEVWKRAVIVFTHADKVEADKLNYMQEGRTKVLKKHIGEYTPQKIVKNIPSVRVTNKSLTNPDNEYWLTNLFTTVFNSMEIDGQRALFMLTAHRIVEVDENKEFITPGKERSEPIRHYGSSGGKPSKPKPQAKGTEPVPTPAPPVPAPPAPKPQADPPISGPAPILVPKHWTDNVVKKIPELKPIVDGIRKVEQMVKDAATSVKNVATSVKNAVGGFFKKLFG